jgi:hypothetical protein
MLWLIDACAFEERWKAMQDGTMIDFAFTNPEKMHEYLEWPKGFLFCSLQTIAE